MMTKDKKGHIEWKKLDAANLPEDEVLVANFQPKTYGYQEKLLGYLVDSKRDEGIVCKNDNTILTNCTHYININAFDFNESVDER